MSIAAHSTLTPSVGAAASAGKLDGNRHAKAAEIVARNCIHAGVVHSGQSKRCKLKDIPLRTPIQVKIGGDVRESPVLLDLVLEGKKGRYTCTPVHAPGCARGHARRPPCLLVYCTVSGVLHRVWYIAPCLVHCTCRCIPTSLRLSASPVPLAARPTPVPSLSRRRAADFLRGCDACSISAWRQSAPCRTSRHGRVPNKTAGGC